MASPDDWESIALLHAQSWIENYRGIVSDEYLDNQVVNERKEVWLKRFSKPNPNQITELVLHENKLVGFSCTFLNHDKKYGALLDNLHVHNDYKRLGIGKQLMNSCFKYLRDKNADTGLYLLVLAENSEAIKFYDKMGGLRMETRAWETPDGGSYDTHLYHWNKQL